MGEVEYSEREGGGRGGEEGENEGKRMRRNEEEKRRKRGWAGELQTKDKEWGGKAKVEGGEGPILTYMISTLM